MSKIIGIDTIGILRYLTDNLPPKIRSIIDEVELEEIQLIIHPIVIGELIYIIKKGRSISGNAIPQDHLDQIVTTLISSRQFIVKDLNVDGWRFVLESTIPELHDRLIAALCVQEGVDLITTDEKIRDSGEIKVIWD